MKKKLLFLPIVVAAMLLTGCESLNLSSIIPQPSSASESAPESSVDELSSGENLSSKDPEFDLSGSDSDPVSSSESSAPASSSAADPGEFIDYVHNGTVKLDVDYKDRDFYVDGIGEVTLDTAIDGDTAHFFPVVKTTSRDKIKIRFYGVDTPESTGKIQPYGHGASVFTAEKLNNAKSNGTIVISTPGEGYKIPQKDSTGTRYLGLIWINETKKNASFDELVLLNLWIIQEGWSWINNVEKVPELANTFMAVEAQSKAFKLNLFSGEDDPDFNYGDYETTSILEMKKEIELQILDSTHKNAFNNRKVRIVGTVAGYVNSTLYLQAFFTKEDGSDRDEGEWAGINIYTGMGGVPSRYTALNTVIMLCGTAIDSDNFGFQISGCNFPQLKSRESDSTARVMLSAEDNVEEGVALNVFEYTVNGLNEVVKNKNFESLNCAVKITEEFNCTDFYISDGGDITLYLNGAGQYATDKFVVYITFNYKGNPDDPTIWNTEEQFVGKKFRVEGVYTFHRFSNGRISMQVCPQNASQLVCTSL